GYRHRPAFPRQRPRIDPAEPVRREPAQRQRHSGATKLTPQGMLSEIHVWENDNGTEFRLGKLIGNLAFHEAMHNKLDADPRFSDDVHAFNATPVGGLSEPVISSKSDLKANETLKMAAALSRVIKQF